MAELNKAAVSETTVSETTVSEPTVIEQTVSKDELDNALEMLNEFTLEKPNVNVSEKVLEGLILVIDKLQPVVFPIGSILVVITWIVGIVTMPIYFSRLSDKSINKAVHGNFSKNIYVGLHSTISLILMCYILIKFCTARTPTKDALIIIEEAEHGIATATATAKAKAQANVIARANATTRANATAKTKEKESPQQLSYSTFLFNFLMFINNIPNIVSHFITMYNKVILDLSIFSISYDGKKYLSQIDMGVTFKLVVSHIPIMVFLLVITSVVAMIKAYHKIMCGNSNSVVIIDWYFRLVDIVMYALFRLIGLVILGESLCLKNKIFSPHLFPLFYLTLVYLILRLLLLLYEELFSKTIVRLYNWQITESGCTNYNDNETNNPNKLTNAVVSLIFNILIIVFLSSISIVSLIIICSLINNTNLKLFNSVASVCSYVLYKTINPAPPAVSSDITSPDDPKWEAEAAAADAKAKAADADAKTKAAEADAKTKAWWWWSG